MTLSRRSTTTVSASPLLSPLTRFSFSWVGACFEQFSAVYWFDLLCHYVLSTRSTDWKYFGACLERFNLLCALISVSPLVLTQRLRGKVPWSSSASLMKMFIVHVRNPQTARARCSVIHFTYIIVITAAETKSTAASMKASKLLSQSKPSLHVNSGNFKKYIYLLKPKELFWNYFTFAPL